MADWEEKPRRIIGQLRRIQHSGLIGVEIRQIEHRGTHHRRLPAVQLTLQIHRAWGWDEDTIRVNGEGDDDVETGVVEVGYGRWENFLQTENT